MARMEKLFKNKDHKIMIPPKVIATIKKLKSEDHRLPPLVFVIRKGKILAGVAAAKVKKELSIQAAAFLKVGFNPDIMISVFDSKFNKCIAIVETSKTKMRTYIVPYQDDNNTITWGKVNTNPKVKGRIFTELFDIMQSRESDAFARIAQSLRITDNRQRRFKQARATLIALESLDYMVFDYFSYLHPEWIDEMPIKKLIEIKPSNN